MFVRVKFNSAKLILETERSNSDKVTELCYNEKKDKFYLFAVDRTNFVNIEIPIQYNSVVNMLRVLFGDRPSPTYRTTLIKTSGVEENIVKTCYYKIYNEDTLTYTTKKGDIKPNIEQTQGKKMVYNSHASQSIYTRVGDTYVGGNVTWNTLKRKYLTCDMTKYENIMSNFKKWCGNDNIENEMTIIDALLYISNTAYKVEAAEFFESNSLKPFTDVINGSDKPSLGTLNSFASKLATRTFNQYQCPKVTLDGEFIFESPTAVIILFSPTSGTMSAIVASAAISM